MAKNRFSHDVTHIVHGEETFFTHFFFELSDTGELFTFGESEGGKLGLGDDPDDTDMPQKVPISERVKSVACGGAHTVALTGNMKLEI